MKFHCPSCGKRYTYHGESKVVRCPVCKVALVAESVSAPAPKTPDPAAPPPLPARAQAVKAPAAPPAIEPIGPKGPTRPPPVVFVPAGPSAPAGAQPADTLWSSCWGSLAYVHTNRLSFMLLFLMSIVPVAVYSVLADGQPLAKVAASTIVIALALMLAAQSIVLSFSVSIIRSTSTGDNRLPALRWIGAAGYVRALGMAVALPLVYVLPIVTLPLLPLGVLAFGLTGDSRALDLRWALGAFRACAGRVGVYWLAVILIALLLGAVSLVASVLFISILTSCREMSLETAAIVVPIAALLAMAVQSYLAVLGNLAATRCVGLLGRYCPEAADRMPPKPSIPWAVGSLAASLLLAVAIVVAVHFLSFVPHILQSSSESSAKAHMERLADELRKYQADHHGQFPATLQELADDRKLKPSQIRSAVLKDKPLVYASYIMPDEDWFPLIVDPWEFQPDDRSQKLTHVVTLGGQVNALPASTIGETLRRANPDMAPQSLPPGQARRVTRKDGSASFIFQTVRPAVLPELPPGANPVQRQGVRAERIRANMKPLTLCLDQFHRLFNRYPASLDELWRSELAPEPGVAFRMLDNAGQDILYAVKADGSTCGTLDLTCHLYDGVPTVLTWQPGQGNWNYRPHLESFYNIRSWGYLGYKPVRRSIDPSQPLSVRKLINLGNLRADVEAYVQANGGALPTELHDLETARCVGSPEDLRVPGSPQAHYEYRSGLKLQLTRPHILLYDPVPLDGMVAVSCLGFDTFWIPDRIQQWIDNSSEQQTWTTEDVLRLLRAAVRTGQTRDVALTLLARASQMQPFHVPLVLPLEPANRLDHLRGVVEMETCTENAPVRDNPQARRVYVRRQPAPFAAKVRTAQGQWEYFPPTAETNDQLRRQGDKACLVLQHQPYTLHWRLEVGAKAVYTSLSHEADFRVLPDNTFAAVIEAKKPGKITLVEVKSGKTTEVDLPGSGYRFDKPPQQDCFHIYNPYKHAGCRLKTDATLAPD